MCNSRRPLGAVSAQAVHAIDLRALVAGLIADAQQGQKSDFAAPPTTQRGRLEGGQTTAAARHRLIQRRW